jgi:AsmA protein
MHNQPPKIPQLPTCAPHEHAVPRRTALSAASRLGAWWKSPFMCGPGGRAVKIGSAILMGLLVLLVAVNAVLSGDWVEARVAARVKEQTGRDLTVNGSTLLLLTPGPHIVVSDAKLTDPDAAKGTADIAIETIKVDLDFASLFSSDVQAERIVLVRPVATVRLGDEGAPMRWGNATEPIKKARFAKAQASVPAPAEPSRRPLRLKDLRIEEGTVVIVYDEDAADARRIEHINAELALPAPSAPLVGSGSFEWKAQAVDFSFEVTTPADLRAKRPAKLWMALDTKALAARFDGAMTTKPDFSGEGTLSAKANSIPSLVAWMREDADVSASLGDGELASELSWTRDEIAFGHVRFALEHASGEGEALVTLLAPRPHLRAAFALDHLDLNPFLASAKAAAKKEERPPAQEAHRLSLEPDVPAERGERPEPVSSRDWFTKPSGAAPEIEQVIAPAPEPTALAPQPSEQVASVTPRPAAFEADVNLNVRKTRLGHLDIGPSSLGASFRDGVLTATLGGMELYGGHASGAVTIDGTKPVPAFSADIRLDGVRAKPLLTDAAQFEMLSGRTRLDLSISGQGEDAETIKASLNGEGAFVVTDGAIEGIDITAFISALGAGDFDLRQGVGAETTFSDLGGSFIITDGLAETTNLKMVSPLLMVAASGAVNLPLNTLDILANPEIIEGPEGHGGANDLAGLTVPVRVEGRLDDPSIRPQIGSMFANTKAATKTVNKIGEAIQKKLQGRPIGEALGQFLGNVQIGGGAPSAPPQAFSPTGPETGQGDVDEAMTPQRLR